MQIKKVDILFRIMILFLISFFIFSEIFLDNEITIITGITTSYIIFMYCLYWYEIKENETDD
jgi:Ca2+/Na+ antiporter